MAGKKKGNGGDPADPSGLRAAGKKLAADEAAKAQSKLAINARDVAVTREEIELPHALAETEVRHIANANAQLQGEIDQLEADKAALQKQITEKNKAIATKHKELSKGSAEVRTGTRMLLVGVRIEHDYQAGVLRYHRLDRGARDVGELYDTKAMDPEEREKAIFTPTNEERIHVEDAKPDEPVPEVQA